MSSNSRLFVYGCGLPSSPPCSSVTVNTSALQLICLAKYGFEDLGVSVARQGLTLTTSSCLKLSVSEAADTPWTQCDTVRTCTCRSESECVCVHVPRHPGLSWAVKVPWCASSFWWLTSSPPRRRSPSWTGRDLQAPGGSRTQFRLRLVVATLLESRTVGHVFTDLYLGQVPLRLGAVSQIVVRLPSIIHRLDPLWHNKHFSVKIK